MANSQSFTQVPTVTRVVSSPHVSAPASRAGARTKPKALSLEERSRAAQSAVFNPLDNDDVLEYMVQTIGETHSEYAIKINLISSVFSSRGIGPNRSENLSKIILNKFRYGVEYSPYTEDMINVALQHPSDSSISFAIKAKYQAKYDI